MSRAPRPAAGGGRWITVAPDRLQRWLDGFAERHGGARCVATADRVVVTAQDGSEAACVVPFPPLAVDGGAPWGGLVEHSKAERRVGVLLVRLAGFAAGVFEGERLVVSKVGSRPVHGRIAAGGWSQQRFARRREGQAHVAMEAAADVACRILLARLDALDAVVTGGDHRAVEAVLADTRLTPVKSLVTPHFLDVPTPDRRVLEGTPALFRSVRIRVREPD